MYLTKTKNNPLRSHLIHTLALLPAVVLGILAMIAEGVSPMLWGQQIAAFIVFMLLGLLLRGIQRIPSFIWTAICLLALAATLFFPTVGSVRRWLDLGLINVNAAMLVLPSLLVLLSSMKCVYPVVLFAAAALCFQPDFSQLTAFSLGALPILWERRKNAFWSAATCILLIACSIHCISTPTTLEPAAHSEGVLAILSNLSPLMQGIGWLALALVPCHFACRFFRCKSMAEICLVIYYTTVIIFSLTGQYPVPFMGFGLSPIAGYWLADLLTPETHR